MFIPRLYCRQEVNLVCEYTGLCAIIHGLSAIYVFGLCAIAIMMIIRQYCSYLLALMNGQVNKAQSSSRYQHVFIFICCLNCLYALNSTSVACNESHEIYLTKAQGS